MEDGEIEERNWDGLSPEVLTMIFQHLPVPDLLSCSVMSKNWKKAARDVLKRSRECYAFIKCFHRDIQDLNEMIASTDIMELINGLHIRNEKMPKEELGRDASIWQNYRRCSDITEKLESEEAGRKLDEAKQKILAVLDGQWKYLNLDMGHGLEQNVSIDDALLLRTVISASKETIQKLMVGQQEDWKLIPCCGNEFSNLKVIETLKSQWSSAYFNEMSWSTFAPKLEEITGAMMDLDVHDPPDPFMLKRMKSIQLNPDADVPEGKSREVFHCISGLYRLDLQQYHCCKYWDDQDLLSWEAFVSPFVLKSLDTLEDLGMYTVEFYKLCNAFSLIFPNLRRLSLAVHWSTKNEVLTLKQLNFAKLCPKLEQMKIIEVVGCQKMRGVVFPGVASDGLLDHSDLPVVVELDCFNGLYCHEYLKILNKVFPKNKLRKLKFQ